MGVASSMLVRLSEAFGKSVGANQSSNIDSPPPPPLTPALRKQILSFLSLRIRREAQREEGGFVATFEILSDKSAFCYVCQTNMLWQWALQVQGADWVLPKWPQELRRSGGAGRAAIGWVLLEGDLWLAEQQGGQQMKEVKTGSNNNCWTWAGAAYQM